jgi:hypothetical protein
MASDKEALEALDELEMELSAVEVAALSSSKLCEKYKKIKPLLQTSLLLIERIPIYGGKIGMAIRFLMSLADTRCANDIV